MSHRHDDVDLYAVLGVEPAVTLAEITAAYHSLARKYHPDVGGDRDQSSRMFKSITAAFEVLSDQQSRSQYDQQRSRVIPVRADPHPPASRRRPPPTQTLESGSILDVPITPEEARFGGPCEIVLTFREPCDCDVETQPNCARCGGEGFRRRRQRTTIQIPAGAASGVVLRLAGQGTSIDEPTRGDVLLRLVVRPSW